MTNDFFWSDTEFLGIFKTKVARTVEGLRFSDFIFSKPDQTYLIPLQCWVVAISSCYHVPQVDQGSSAGEDSHSVSGVIGVSWLDLLPKKGGEGEDWTNVAMSLDLLHGSLFSKCNAAMQNTTK